MHSAMTDTTRTAFIIDDDKSIASLHARLLRINGFEPRIFHTVRDALDAIGYNAATGSIDAALLPTVIVTDNNTPGTHKGVELCSILKDSGCGVVLASADDRPFVTRQAAEANAVFLLKGSYGRDELFAATRRACEIGMLSKLSLSQKQGGRGLA